jgi:hypothetical protein
MGSWTTGFSRSFTSLCDSVRHFKDNDQEVRTPYFGASQRWGIATVKFFPARQTKIEVSAFFLPGILLRYGDSRPEIACVFGTESLHQVLEAFVALTARSYL